MIVTKEHRARNYKCDVCGTGSKIIYKLQSEYHFSRCLLVCERCMKKIGRVLGGVRSTTTR